jgi:hypothetical protein
MTPSLPLTPEEFWGGYRRPPATGNDLQMRLFDPDLGERP